MNKTLANVLVLVIVATMAALVVGDAATDPFRGYCRVCKDARRIEFWHDAYFCDICGWESSVQPMKLPGDAPADVNPDPPASANSQRTPAATAHPKNTTPTKRKVEPYSLKGDKVGMRLSEFKRKYRRAVDNRHAPFCSDATPDHDNVMLSTAPWHWAAGIVSCSKVFPFEWIQDESKKRTVAGVAADLLVYQFVDGFLYQIMVRLPHDGYATVRRALDTKWGPPTSESKKLVQNAMGAKFSNRTTTWTNDVSRIQLRERETRLNTSLLVFVDIELYDVAMERQPDTSADDL